MGTNDPILFLFLFDLIAANFSYKTAIKLFSYADRAFAKACKPKIREEEMLKAQDHC